ncbi:hypothetical protein NC653_040118 [Populus alba x Populus x berolinensis]|uniref:Uncharacterized protein n=1 Tax=Populus alba x Populus x berolinensis TaxID=444605 RepID=A0AAD6LCW2_9ROSI|nr:hypothetical protein NC653_040118 [Populus alba x Populus x berolinensis]
MPNCSIDLSLEVILGSESIYSEKSSSNALAELGGSLKNHSSPGSAIRSDILDCSLMSLNMYGIQVKPPEGKCQSSLKYEIDVPWKAFFQTPAVWAMIYAHFCGSWGHYTCLSWLPSYFSEELSLNLTEAAWVSILPPLASVFVTSIAAQLADKLISNGVEITTVRKICQTIAFLSPALCMTLSSVDLGLPPWEIVGILTAGLALSSFALSGLYCTHQDMSPEYASILLVWHYQHCRSNTWNCRDSLDWLSTRYNSFMEYFIVRSINFLLLDWYHCMVGICQQQAFKLFQHGLTLDGYSWMKHPN